MEDMIKLNPDSARARSLWAQYLQTNGQEKQGLVQAEKAATISPKDGRRLLSPRGWRQGMGDIDKAWA